MSDTKQQGQQGQHGEPWSVREEYEETRILDASRAIIFCESTEPDEEGNDQVLPRMKHIVECVNGCAGMDPKAYKAVLASCKELRDALAAWLRIIGPTRYQDAYLEEMARIGIKNGIGLRADTAIAKAQRKEPTHDTAQ